MTSTSFNIGVDLEGKNSSRVLRPPGGGHTDIFGLRDPIVPEIRKEDNKRNASSILEGTNTELNQAKKEQIKTEEKSTQEMNKNKESSPKEVDEQSAPRRPRVPPGGFSSGLW